MRIDKLNEKTFKFVTLSVDKQLLVITYHLKDGGLDPTLPIIFKCQFEITKDLIDNLLLNILPSSFKKCSHLLHSFFRDNKEIIEDLSDWFLNEYLEGGSDE